MRDVSVVIPIKDEPYITTLVSEINRVLSSYDHEVIVVDESYEPTHLKNATVIRQRSHGIGNAFIEGLHQSHGKYIVLMDGDGQHRPQDIPLLLSSLSSFDFAIGSKLAKGGKAFNSDERMFVTKLLGKLASTILGLPIKDSMSGFAAMKRSAISSIRLNPLGYKIALEAAYKLKKKGFVIGEVPIMFLKRQKGKSKVGFNLKGFTELIRILRLIVELKLGIR
ncbi:MAG: glycosyltransferase [Candidatus Aenigmatarchaeota archaeon]